MKYTQGEVTVRQALRKEEEIDGILVEEERFHSVKHNGQQNRTEGAFRWR